MRRSDIDMEAEQRRLKVMEDQRRLAIPGAPRARRNSESGLAPMSMVQALTPTGFEQRVLAGRHLRGRSLSPLTFTSLKNNSLYWALAVAIDAARLFERVFEQNVLHLPSSGSSAEPWT